MTRQGPARWLLNSTTRLSCRLADWVWCDSASLREFMINARLCSPDKLVVLGRGSVGGVDSAGRFCPSRISAAARSALRAHYQMAPDALVLGFVGRLVCDKGLRELAAAWRSLRERHQNLRLLLVGPCEQADGLPLEDLRRLRADDRVHLTGMIDDVAEHLSIMDVFVNPSHREGFGVANAEASSMGLPVVSTRIPGCVDSVVDGVTGSLLPPRDPQALCDALEAYLTDPELRARHGHAGRERVVQCFQPETSWRALESAYDDLLANAARQQSNVVQTV